MTLVSVITPTWQRHDYLLDRCIPSVLAQTHPDVEHIVVSDGPDAELVSRAGRVMDAPGGERVAFEYLPEHTDNRWGHWARLRGIDLAEGEYIAYLDDDDAYRPEHCAVLAAALDENPGADFAYSQMSMQGVVVGSDPPVYCQIGTPMIMHRRSCLEFGTWEQSFPSIDWDLVERWLAAGAKHVYVPQVTVDVWPSAYR